MIVVIFVLVITSTFRFSLFPSGSKLHGAVSKIARSKHIGTLVLPVGVGVGSTMVVVIIAVDLVVELEAIVMETTLVKVQTLTTGMLDGSTIGFSYQYVPEYVKVAGPGCLSVSSPSVLALKPGIRKRGTASAEADVARSTAVVRRLCILRKLLEGEWCSGLMSKGFTCVYYA